MAAIKTAVGIAVDIVGSVIRINIFPPLALGITAVVMLGPSDTVHADTSTDTFLLGVISAVMLLGMLIAGCVVQSATKSLVSAGLRLGHAAGVPRVTSIRATRSR